MTQGREAKSTSPKRVLVIDDDDDSRYIFRTAIKAEGYDVLEASDGSTALIDAIVFAPHLVILDVGLPEMKGWELLTVIRNHPATAHTKVIVVTARPRNEDRIFVADLGIEAYFTKPIGPWDIVKEVRRQIGEA